MKAMDMCLTLALLDTSHSTSSRCKLELSAACIQAAKTVLVVRTCNQEPHICADVYVLASKNACFDVDIVKCSIMPFNCAAVFLHLM